MYNNLEFFKRWPICDGIQGTAQMTENEISQMKQEHFEIKENVDDIHAGDGHGRNHKPNWLATDQTETTTEALEIGLHGVAYHITVDEQQHLGVVEQSAVKRRLS